MVSLFSSFLSLPLYLCPSRIYMYTYKYVCVVMEVAYISSQEIFKLNLKWEWIHIANLMMAIFPKFVSDGSQTRTCVHSLCVDG